MEKNSHPGSVTLIPRVLYTAHPPKSEQLLGLLRQLELCLHVFLHEVALFLQNYISLYTYCTLLTHLTEKLLGLLRQLELRLHVFLHEVALFLQNYISLYTYCILLTHLTESSFLACCASLSSVSTCFCTRYRCASRTK